LVLRGTKPWESVAEKGHCAGNVIEKNSAYLWSPRTAERGRRVAMTCCRPDKTPSLYSWGKKKRKKKGPGRHVPSLDVYAASPLKGKRGKRGGKGGVFMPMWKRPYPFSPSYPSVGGRSTTRTPVTEEKGRGLPPELRGNRPRLLPARRGEREGVNGIPTNLEVLSQLPWLARERTETGGEKEEMSVSESLSEKHSLRNPVKKKGETEHEHATMGEPLVCSGVRQGKKEEEGPPPPPPNKGKKKPPAHSLPKKKAMAKNS